MIGRHNEPPLWSYAYGDYQAFLYQSHDHISVQIKTHTGNTLETRKIVFGVLKELPLSTLIQCCADQTLRNNIALFPYPNIEQLHEVWMFKATPAAAFYLRKAKKTYQKETSIKNYEKIHRHLQTAFKIDSENPEIKKALFDIKQELFFLLAPSNTHYLSTHDEVESFSKMLKDLPSFESLVDWIDAWNSAKQPHIYLVHALVYEWLLDHVSRQLSFPVSDNYLCRLTSLEAVGSLAVPFI